jgi:hypothetical protein
VDKALRPPSGYTYSRVTDLQSETLPPIGDDYTIPAGSRVELLRLDASVTMTRLERAGPASIARS